MSQHPKFDEQGPLSVLLITDDVTFRCKVVQEWHQDAEPPLVICIPSDLTPNAQVTWCDLLILGPVQPERLADVLVAAGGAPAAVAFLPWGVSLQQVQLANPNILPLHCTDAAAEMAVLVGKALLRRTAVERRLMVAETTVRDCGLEAALGHFMLESRHSFNNALTTVLGTAELLLLLDSVKLGAEQREQIRTVHAMAMRLYQMMAQFSALEAQLKLTASRAHGLPGTAFPPASQRPEVQQ